MINMTNNRDELLNMLEALMGTVSRPRQLDTPEMIKQIEEAYKYKRINELKNIIQTDPSTIKYMYKRVFGMIDIENELAMLAVKIEPESIKYISEPANSICELAVRLQPDVIRFLDNPTLTVAKTAVMGDPSTLKYIPQTHYDVCQKLVNENYVSAKQF